MKNFLSRYWYIILFTVFGIFGGFLYWKFIGCTSGSCPITSKWHASSLAGGVMGYLAGSIIYDYFTKSSVK